MERNEKAEELAKDGVEMFGGAKAAAKASTRKQLRKELYGSTEYAVQFHVQVEAWQDRAEIVPEEEEFWANCAKEKERQ